MKTKTIFLALVLWMGMTANGYAQTNENQEPTLKETCDFIKKMTPQYPDQVCGVGEKGYIVEKYQLDFQDCEVHLSTLLFPWGDQNSPRKFGIDIIFNLHDIVGFDWTVYEGTNLVQVHVSKKLVRNKAKGTINEFFLGNNYYIGEDKFFLICRCEPERYIKAFKHAVKLCGGNIVEPKIVEPKKDPF